MTTPSRQRRQRARQQRDILDAARVLLLREGAEQFSMRGLAREVGCAPGTLYLYFEDKDHLIAALVEESFEHLMAELEASAVDSSPLVLLERIMRTYVAFGLDHPDHYHFAFMLRRTPRLEEVRPRPHRSFDLLNETLRACAAQGLIGPVDPDLAARGVWTGIHGVTSLMITIPNFPWRDRQAVIDHVVASQLVALRSLPAEGLENEGDVDDAP